MKRHFLRTAAIALVTFLLGSAIDYLSNAEMTVGLDTLFHIRGTRSPPAEVVVVAMDESSESRLKVGQDLTRWRIFHSRLIQELKHQGALLIIFDLQFIVSHPDHDPEFAAAMQAAGNVLMTDCVQKLRSGDKDFYGRDECSESNKQPFVDKVGEHDNPLSEKIIGQRAIFPTPLLADSALDHAPFYLTNDAENPVIREVWTFFDSLAEKPALPVVVWFYYLQRTGALDDKIHSGISLSAWLTEQRRQCSSAADKPSKILSKQSNLETRINDVICRGDSRYLDFYGPPQTLRMESYSDVIDGKVTDLKGKVVFVGKSNRLYSPGKTDYFQTPFSDTQSGEMAGVEIMATQFANLLEGRFVESLVAPALVLLSFGLVIGLQLTCMPGFYGLFASLLITGGFISLAAGIFKQTGLWLPVAVPLLIQLPIAWLLSLLWSRRDLLHERKRIIDFVRQVFPQWVTFVPALPGQWYPEQGSTPLTTERDVSGLCLATDIKGYTTIASKHTPHEMWDLIKGYYSVLGYPVSSHQGIIANIQGDALMAIWIDLPPEILRHAACLAALDMQQAVERFNMNSTAGPLPTRIGLHEGDMVLGCGEAGGLRFHNPFGDTVNTASRIEGVNTFLDTQILASSTVVAGLTDIFYRPVGAFCVKGRAEPLDLVEIVGKDADLSDTQKLFYKQFAESLAIFQQGQWQAAAASFQSLLNKQADDGPTRYYLNRSLSYLKDPPVRWEGVIHLDEK